MASVMIALRTFPSRCLLAGCLFAGCLFAALVGGCAATPPVQDVDDERWPVILVHGMAGQARYPIVGNYFRGIEEALVAARVPVVVPTLPAYASSAQRAEALRTVVEDVLASRAATKVHLIGHSQGGLDSRYLVEQSLGPERAAEVIGSITTLSTPHRGTPVASVFDLTVPAPLVDVALSAAQVGMRAGRGPYELVDGAGAVHTNAEGGPELESYPVPAFSVAAVAGRAQDGACDGGSWGEPVGVAAPQPWLVPTWSAISASRPGVVRSNDGLVPVDSMRWQHFLGCVPADHVSVVGLGGLTLEPDQAARFDPARFFVGLAQSLRLLEHGVDADSIAAIRPPFAARYLQ